MGLDMFLYRQRYVRGDKAQRIKELVGEKSEGDSVSVKTDVAYWRKANAIHRFFYDFTGEDEDRREIYVPYESLEGLLKRCKEIKSKAELVDGTELVDEWRDGEKHKVEIKVKKIKDARVCEELLPTQEGFFFGDTSYGEYYLDNINDTIEQLEKIIADDVRATDDYYYYGSW